MRIWFKLKKYKKWLIKQKKKCSFIDLLYPCGILKFCSHYFHRYVQTVMCILMWCFKYIYVCVHSYFNANSIYFIYQKLFKYYNIFNSNLFEEDVASVWNYSHSVDQYSAEGGTAANSVKEQISALSAWLASNSA